MYTTSRIPRVEYRYSSSKYPLLASGNPIDRMPVPPYCTIKRRDVLKAKRQSTGQQVVPSGSGCIQCLLHPGAGKQPGPTSSPRERAPASERRCRTTVWHNVARFFRDGTSPRRYRRPADVYTFADLRIRKLECSRSIGVRTCGRYRGCRTPGSQDRRWRG